MHTDTEACVRAVRSRDARFDGWFYTGVRTTGIYCRPSCPAMTPNPRNMVFYPSAAAASAGGYRACRRCRPDLTPGSPEWNVRADVVARAMRLIADGVVDREGVEGLAGRLGYSVRQIERQVRAELGAGPLALARIQRARAARVLIETTNLPLSDVAFASGFGSIRAFNHTIQEVYAAAPSVLRQRRPRGAQPSKDQVWHHLTVRLAFRTPFWPDNVFGHLAATAVPGVEEWREGSFRRSLSLSHGPAVMALTPHADHVAARLWLSDLRDLTGAVNRARWLLDLDADPEAIDQLLSADPRLRPLVAAAPGRRVPRSADPQEMALRIVIGQQVSTRAAQTLAGRIVADHGVELPEPVDGVTHLFPDADRVAAMSPEELAMPATRRRTVIDLAAKLAAAEVDLSPACDPQAARVALAQIRGVGPWTIESLAMRAWGDPDAFPATDLGVRAGLRSLGVSETGVALTQETADWRPWRAYATQHLWAMGDHEINTLPREGREE